MATFSKDHLGNEFPSLAAMCRHWNLDCEMVKGRLNRGLSIEEALTNPVCSCKGINSVDHEGNKFPSVRAMCRHWGIRFSTFTFRLERGWSLKEALTAPMVYSKVKGVGTRCQDHEGTEFPTFRAMCEHWHISYANFAYRRSQGWSVKRALTTRK